MTAPQMPATLDEAMAAFQAQLPSITKDEKATVQPKEGRSYSYGYAGLDTVSEKVLRALGALGVSWRTRPTLDESGRFVLAYRLRHINGDEETGTWPLVGSTPQQMGSAITYARRYSLMAVTGVFPKDEDDDGAAASSARPADDEWNNSRPARPARTGPTAEQIRDEAIRDTTTSARLRELYEANKPLLTATVDKEDGGQERLGDLLIRLGKQRAADEPPTDHQHRTMHALWREAAITDRDERLDFTRTWLARDIESSKELTGADADALIARLRTYIAENTPPADQPARTPAGASA